MSQSITEFLDGLDIDSMDALDASGAAGAGTGGVVLRGRLVARGPERIALASGDRVIEIPISGLLRLESDPAPPAIARGRGVPVCAEVDGSTEVVVRRRCTASELGGEVGIRPLVLSRPSQASDYLTRYDAGRDRERHVRLGLDYPERPSDAQALDSTKTTIGGTRFRTVFTTVTEHGDKMDVEMDDETDELGPDKYD